MIDIILPCYNSEPRLLDQSLDSIARQMTSYKYSVYVVDDGGTDDHFLKQRVYQYRFIYHRIDHSGLPTALNIGHSLGNRKYCCWTSDDNLLAPTFVQRMVDEAEHGFDFVRSLEQHIRRAGPPAYIVDPRHGNSALPVAGKYDGYLGAGHIYTRELYERTKGYDPELAGIEDLDFYYQIMSLHPPIREGGRIPRIGFVNEALYIYRDGTSRFTEAYVAEARQKLIAKWGLK